MKSLNNYVSAAGLIASLEALMLLKKVGIEEENFLKLLMEQLVKIIVQKLS